MTTFRATLDDLAGVGGWLSEDQAERLWTRAAAVAPGGRIVEIGSFQGRSTIVLARAAPAGVEVVAIDPHAGNDRGPQEFEGYEHEAAADHERFHRNLDRAGVAARVRHVREASAAAHGLVAGDVDLLFIDGAHRYRPARADVRDWGVRVAQGGTMLVHDSFSSVGVTLALGRELLASSSWRYVGRSRSLAEYRREPVRGMARAANAARQVAQLGWFTKNVVVKLLVAARLRHGPWPY